MAAAIEGMLILVGSGVIAFEAIRHLDPGLAASQRLGFGIVVIWRSSIVVNLLVSRTARAAAPRRPARRRSPPTRPT